MQYIIYKLTNHINGKVYIGKTKRGLRKRLGEHITQSSCRYLHNAIKKYGLNSFEIDILAQASDELEMSSLEHEYIVKYDCLVPNGYNLTMETDQGRSFHERTRNMMSHNVQGRTVQGKQWSKYIGVRTRSDIHCFAVRITHRKKAFIHYYSTEQEAAEAYDKVALFLYGWNARRNFFEKLPCYRSMDLKAFFKSFCSKNKKTSKYVGVSYASYLTENPWRAVAYKNGKQINLGVFPTEMEACIARLKYETTKT